jgi:hypothetical protein
MADSRALSRRSATFARSDIFNAAHDFVVALAEHADTIWEDSDIEDLAEQLTERGFRVLRDPGERF